MSETGKLKGRYKPTGNIAVDMVAACINHYARQGRKVKYIRLDFIHWTMFSGFVLEKIPMYDLSNGEIEFGDDEPATIVTEGSKLMVKTMYWELEPLAKKIFLMN